MREQKSFDHSEGSVGGIRGDAAQPDCAGGRDAFAMDQSAPEQFGTGSPRFCARSKLEITPLVGCERMEPLSTRFRFPRVYQRCPPLTVAGLSASH